MLRKNIEQLGDDSTPLQKIAARTINFEPMDRKSKRLCSHVIENIKRIPLLEAAARQSEQVAHELNALLSDTQRKARKAFNLSRGKDGHLPKSKAYKKLALH